MLDSLGVYLCRLHGYGALVNTPLAPLVTATEIFGCKAVSTSLIRACFRSTLGRAVYAIHLKRTRLSKLSRVKVICRPHAHPTSGNLGICI